jgi:hypothetical protein
MLDAALREHLAACPECAGAYRLMEGLRRGDPFPEPSDADFLALRRGVLRELRKDEVRRSTRVPRPTLALAASVLLVLGGVAAGRLTAPGRPRIPASEDALVAQIKRAALAAPGVQDPGRASFAYENVRAEAIGAGTVALSFDVTRHVALTLPKNDPLVADVLVRTLVGAAPVGEKLQAISCAGTALDPKVRDGLVQAMLTDRNLGVRLKAQARLVELSSDPKVQDALLRVLQREASVQMKLVAIESLASRRINPDLLRQAIAPAPRDAAYLKAMDYLDANGERL